MTTIPVYSADYELVCASTSIFDVNVATLKNIPSDWTVGHQISTEFRIAAGGQQIAGLTLNYLPTGAYVAVVVDSNTGNLRVIRFNGANFVTEFTLAFADFNFVFDLNRWHKLAVTPTMIAATNTIALSGTLSDVAATKSVSFATSLASYGPLIGTIGIFADRTYAYFNKLRIEQ